MMKIHYDDDLLESAVFLCASGRRKDVPSLQVARFHRGREKIYSILDPDERNTAFFQLHLEWFREWGLESWLHKAVGDFPLLEAQLDGIAFRKARVRNDEGAELFVSAEHGRRAVVALQPERFGAQDGMTRFLNHELMHINDMIDPAFVYSPQLQIPAGVRAHERLVRERYRLLWDVTIDGRLHQRGFAIESSRDQRWAEFERAFAFCEDHQRIFEELWSTPTPRHAALTALACDPRNVAGVEEPIEGARCPLCGFATFNWAKMEIVAPETVAAIHREFPTWNEKESACARCVEVYDAARLHVSAVR